MVAPEYAQPPAHKPDASAPDNADAPDPAAADAPGQSQAAPPEALHLLLAQMAALKEYASYYAAARANRVKLSLHRWLLRMMLVALTLVTVAGILVFASWFVLKGLAEGLGVLFDHRVWLGNLVAGLLALAAVGIGMWSAIALHRRHSLKRSIERDDRRQDQQRSACGHSVRDRAADAAARE